jgi:uncharacterized protein YjbJ (UPF0337 family)
MHKDRIIGAGKQIIGAAKQVVGELIGDARLQADGKSEQVDGKLQADGKAEQVDGKLQNAAGSVEDTLQRWDVRACPQSFSSRSF